MSGHFNDYTSSDSPTPSFVTDPAYATVVVPALDARDAKICNIARRRDALKEGKTTMKKDTLKSLAKEKAIARAVCSAIIDTARDAFYAIVNPAYDACAAELRDIDRRHAALKHARIKVEK